MPMPHQPATLPAPATLQPPVPPRPGLACVGPPALLAGEDAAGYEALRARIAATLAPADVLEEIWTRDVVDLVWEIFRLRRLKAALMQEAAYQGLADVLRPRHALLPQPECQATATQWACGDRAASAVVDKALAKSGLSMDAVRARTLALRIDDVERIDRMTMVAEGRRDTILRELERHRASTAQRLRRALGAAEDAEFEVIAPDDAAGPGGGSEIRVSR